ncbi:hypothetical protein [Bradyrhizobium nitroreducens]|uniref:hypothetical protein n=1 Tax=Bradyrhizobium nitroreducens TaxID=709803 RepID=UPI001374A6C2|nr:hypothetical protein [Bradyrhizobium nitroreducens]
MILWSAMSADDSLPDNVTTLQAMLRAERAARLAECITPPSIKHLKSHGLYVLPERD